MKTGLTKILTLGSMALLALASCTKNDPKVTLNASGSGTLSASTTTLPLDKTKLNDTTKVITFTTTVPKFGFSAAVTSTLQIDADGDNWKNPTSVTLGNKVYSQGYSTMDFNNMLLKLNLPAGVASKVNVRMQYALSAAEATYSNIVSVTVTPFNLTSWIWVPGDYEGWNNAGGGLDSLVSPTGNGVYSGIINIPAGGTMQFKLLPVKGSWSVAYGDAGGGAISTSGGNLMAPIAGGQFLMTADLNKKTFTIVAADYYSLIGNDFSGQNWDHDNFMKFVNDGNNNWVLTIPMIAPTGGGFKVRQDAQWSNSWGIPKAGSAGDGVANALNNTSNNNITIAADGTYKVTFNMAPSAYGSPAVTLASYTAVKQ
jgi:hypothetical protein